jgi:hypothetical protein
MVQDDSGNPLLQYLIDLHEETMEVGGGYWATFRVWRVEPTVNVPHGLRYSLTLHSPGGSRLVGYDNAHLPDEIAARKRDDRARQPHDHIHYEGRLIRMYTFRGPGELMEDFWASVELKLKEEGVE